MIRRAIVDTGPLVALLDRAEQYHGWAAEQVKQLDPPMLVCEPVLVETMFLLTIFVPLILTLRFIVSMAGTL
jgi:predicted nucleic acid-binding protein